MLYTCNCNKMHNHVLHYNFIQGEEFICSAYPWQADALSIAANQQHCFGGTVEYVVFVVQFE